jgi:membrane protease subunit HflK
MPWTEESDPSSPSTAPKGVSQGRGPDAGPPEAGRRGDASAEAPAVKGRPRTAGRPAAGPWGAASGKRQARPTRSQGGSSTTPRAPPEFDKAIQGVKTKVSGVLDRSLDRRLRHRLLIGALVGFAAGWAVSGVYQVRPDERAVITRLGVVMGEAGPGLHAHLPWPLERAQILAVTRINTLTLGEATDAGSQSLTPTGDGQMADPTYTVHWRIADPVAYLFHVADPQGALRLAAEASMRQAVGSAPLAAWMSADRARLERRLAAAIQQQLNHLGAGIVVTGVRVDGVRSPPDVQTAAADVAIARQDAEASIADAQTYRTRTLTEAKAAAAKALIEAQSYRDQTIEEAKGAAARFEQLDAAYRKAPGVTKDRLYFETLQGVLSRAHTIVLDAAKGAVVTLPPELFHSAQPPRAPSPASASPASSGAKP